MRISARALTQLLTPLTPLTTIAAMLLAAGPASADDRTEARRVLLATQTSTYAPLAPDVLKAIEDDYIDPARVSPDQMLRAAVDALAQLVPELKITPAQGGMIKVTLGTTSVHVGARDTIDLAELAGETSRLVELVAEQRPGVYSKAGLEAVLLDGALSTLDGTSRMITPDELLARSGQLAYKTGGIGVDLTMQDGVLRVFEPIPDGPSAKAGLRPGDMIVAIDDVQTKKMSFDDALVRLRGPIGSKIAVTVTREAWKKPVTYLLERGTIEPKQVEAKRLSGDIAYVRVRSLTAAVAKELPAVLERVTPRRAKLRGVILDLRGTGGSFDAAIEVADVFLPAGDVATVMTRRTRDAKVAKSSAKDITETPVAVLVDRETRTSGEVLAGALSGSDRALLVGEKTRGAASSGKLITLAGGFAAELRATQIVTTGGKKIDEVGLMPDVVVRSSRAPKDGAADVILAPEGDTAFTVELARRVLDKAGNAKREYIVRDMRATLDAARPR